MRGVRGFFIFCLVLIAVLVVVSANPSWLRFTGNPIANCGNGILDSGELCDYAAPEGEHNAYGSLCNNYCQISGSTGGGVICRGHGAAVCVEKVPDGYFEEHPLCIPNYACGGKYYLCNAICPPPSNVSTGGNSTTNQTNSTCLNECGKEETLQCNGNISQKCGNYDSDTCLEWSSGSLCQYGCVDGICLPSVNISECVYDSDCAANEACISGICIPETNVSECVYDSDCTSTYGKYCNEEGAVCEQGTFSECVSGFCKERGGYGGCYPPCNNGCFEGECVIEEYPPQSCNSLVEKIKNPVEFNIYGIKYMPSDYTHIRDDSFYVQGVLEPAVTYSASWYGYTDSWENYNSYNLDYDISVFENKNIDLVSWISEEFSGYNLCTVRSFWINDVEEKVYLCVWAFDNEELNVDMWQSKYVSVIWPNSNVLVQIGTRFGESLTEEEALLLSQERMADFLESLRDNSYDGWGNYELFDLDYPIYLSVENDLLSCSSDIPDSTCSPVWDCKTEPVICPPHGYQTKTCIDYSCNSETIEYQTYCSPGICAGCIVPEWFGSKWSNNKCIPYGFRFAQETGDFVDELVEVSDDEVLYEQDFEEGGYSLVVESSDRAVLTLYGINGFTAEYVLTPGAEINIDTSELGVDDEDTNFVLIVNSISYDPSETNPNSVDITIKYTYMGQTQQTMNAYCDIDGYVKTQKTPLSDGTWAPCQNNYECDSNVCSSGECIEVGSLLRETSAFKKTAVQIACRFFNPFSQEGYNSCLQDLL